MIVIFGQHEFGFCKVGSWGNGSKQEEGGGAGVRRGRLENKSAVFDVVVVEVEGSIAVVENVFFLMADRLVDLFVYASFGFFGGVARSIAVIVESGLQAPAACTSTKSE